MLNILYHSIFIERRVSVHYKKPAFCLLTIFLYNTVHNLGNKKKVCPRVYIDFRPVVTYNTLFLILFIFYLLVSLRFFLTLQYRLSRCTDGALFSISWDLSALSPFTLLPSFKSVSLVHPHSKMPPSFKNVRPFSL